jgi:hypothetical protein
MPRNNEDFNEGGTTIDVGAEGIHKMDKTGVSKVDVKTGKGLFIPFTMTSRSNPEISFSGSHIGEEAYNQMAERHGEKWDIRRHDQ